MLQFVPLSTIQRLSFSSFHTARATFYRRAKVSWTPKLVVYG